MSHLPAKPASAVAAAAVLQPPHPGIEPTLFLEALDALQIVSPHSVPPTHAGAGEGGGSQRPADDTLPKLGKAVLSGREREVLHWMREGKTNPEIALILGLSFKTVKNQVQSILVKLRVSNRAQAVARAIAAGLLAPDSRTPASTMSPAAFERESLALLQSPRRARREERGSRTLAALRLPAAPGELG